VIDPVSVLIAAALFAVGWLLGRHARLKSTPKQPKPICLCGDHYGTHDPVTGECQAQEKERFQQDAGGFSRDVWVRCACVRYTGPQPVEQYWVPPAADMSIVTAPRAIEPRGER
jgi:hypothetical protein